jgi:PAS domain-containing protein
LLATIAMEVAATSDLSCALEVVLHRVCEKTVLALGQAWVPSQDGTVLECGPIWYGDEANLKSFRTASEECNFVRGVGLPGRVWALEKPAWVEDVRNDPNFPRMEAARTVGLRTGVGIPILSGDHVIAVIEFFMHESRTANERLVKVIAAVAAQLDMVMERKRAADKLAQTNEILQSILSNMGDAVIVADTEGKFLLFNPMAERMFGMGATRTASSEWSHRYGLYLPDKVCLPHFLGQ